MEYQSRCKDRYDSTLTETLTRDQPSSLQTIMDSINLLFEKTDMRLNTKKCEGSSSTSGNIRQTCPRLYLIINRLKS